MDETNVQLTSSHLAQVKLESVAEPPDIAGKTSSGALDSISESPSVTASAIPAMSLSEDCSSPHSEENSDSAPTSDSFQFKTPVAVRSFSKQSHASASKEQSSSSKSEGIAGGSRSRSPSKKNPAVKIASFAKASPIDRLAPSSNVQSVQALQEKFDSSSSATPSTFTSQSTTGGGLKQPMTQTSLPTPALNAALRSFFNYSSQSEASPGSNASHSEEEDEDGDDEDVEEEEVLVYMQFDSKLDSDLLQPHTPFKIIGVDSEKPVLQLGNQVFEGNWADTVGTAVFFKEQPSASPGDPVFMKNPPTTLSYHSKTQKALIMSRIFVKPKAAEDDTDPTSSATGPMVPMAIVEVPR